MLVLFLSLCAAFNETTLVGKLFAPTVRNVFIELDCVTCASAEFAESIGYVTSNTTGELVYAVSVNRRETDVNLASHHLMRFVRSRPCVIYIEWFLSTDESVEELVLLNERYGYEVFDQNMRVPASNYAHMSSTTYELRQDSPFCDESAREVDANTNNTIDVVVPLRTLDCSVPRFVAHLRYYCLQCETIYFLVDNVTMCETVAYYDSNVECLLYDTVMRPVTQEQILDMVTSTSTYKHIHLYIDQFASWSAALNIPTLNEAYLVIRPNVFLLQPLYTDVDSKCVLYTERARSQQLRRLIIDTHSSLLPGHETVFPSLDMNWNRDVQVLMKSHVRELVQELEKFATRWNSTRGDMFAKIITKYIERVPDRPAAHATAFSSIEMYASFVVTTSDYIVEASVRSRRVKRLGESQCPAWNDLYTHGAHWVIVERHSGMSESRRQPRRIK